MHCVVMSNLYSCGIYGVIESDFVQCTEQILFYGVVNRLLVIPIDTVKTLNWVNFLNNHAEKATTSYKFSILN
jgi:hypothetical protein